MSEHISAAIRETDPSVYGTHESLLYHVKMATFETGLAHTITAQVLDRWQEIKESDDLFGDHTLGQVISDALVDVLADYRPTYDQLTPEEKEHGIADISNVLRSKYGNSN